MNISNAGWACLEAMETCVPWCYDDADPEHRQVPIGHVFRGTPTIGWGHTGSEVVPGLTWSQERCDAQLQADVEPIVAGLNRIITANLSNNEFSAVVLIGYNDGLPAVEKSALNGGTVAVINQGLFGMVPMHIRSWNKIEVNGVLTVSPGLVGRCAAEVALWELETGAPAPDFKAISDAAVAQYEAYGTMA